MKTAIRQRLGLVRFSQREDRWINIAGLIWVIGLGVSVVSVGLPIWVTLLGFTGLGLGIAMYWLTI